RVELRRSGKSVECRVLDNGSAPVTFRPGRGLKIVNELAKALDGRFDQKFGTEGSASIVAFPSRGEPQITAIGRIHSGTSPASADATVVKDGYARRSKIFV